MGLNVRAALVEAWGELSLGRGCDEVAAGWS